MLHPSLRQTVRLGAGVAFAQIGIIGFDGLIELEALRLYGLPEDAPAVLYGCPSLPAGAWTLALETSWDLPSLGTGATANVDVSVPGARRGDFADASLDTSSIAFVLDCHLWSNNSVRVTARNVIASTVDLSAATLAVQVAKRTLPKARPLRGRGQSYQVVGVGGARLRREPPLLRAQRRAPGRSGRNRAAAAGEPPRRIYQPTMFYCNSFRYGYALVAMRSRAKNLK